MEHIAILSKKFRLLDKILSGEKTIESRWYKFKKPPYESISIGDTIYFKEGGDPIKVKATVERVLFFNSPNPEKIKEILLKYHKMIGVDMDYFELIKNKKFCTLIFLKNVEKIKPFFIKKEGYGLMSAWICVDDVEKIRI